jgi:hypothetical protein
MHKSQGSAGLTKPHARPFESLYDRWRGVARFIFGTKNEIAVLSSRPGMYNRWSTALALAEGAERRSACSLVSSPEGQTVGPCSS